MIVVIAKPEIRGSSICIFYQYNFDSLFQHNVVITFLCFLNLHCRVFQDIINSLNYSIWLGLLVMAFSCNFDATLCYIAYVIMQKMCYFLWFWCEVFCFQRLKLFLMKRRFSFKTSQNWVDASDIIRTLRSMIEVYYADVRRAVCFRKISPAIFTNSQTSLKQIPYLKPYAVSN